MITNKRKNSVSILFVSLMLAIAVNLCCSTVTHAQNLQRDGVYTFSIEPIEKFRANVQELYQTQNSANDKINEQIQQRMEEQYQEESSDEGSVDSIEYINAVEPDDADFIEHALRGFTDDQSDEVEPRSNRGASIAPADTDPMFTEDGGWWNSRLDPTKIVAFCGKLSIRKGWNLHAYLFSTGMNGNGYVIAGRSEKTIPSLPAIAKAFEGIYIIDSNMIVDELPGIYNRMVAIDGDGSPLSYLQASLLDRELGDFGALWHGIQWGAHKVVDRLPTPTEDDDMDADPMFSSQTKPNQWKWKTRRPAKMDPTVSIDGDVVEVTFYSFTPLMDDEGGEKIVRHVDTYLTDNYIPIKRERKVIAVGKGGLCF